MDPESEYVSAQIRRLMTGEAGIGETINDGRIPVQIRNLVYNFVHGQEQEMMQARNMLWQVAAISASE